MTVNWGSWSAFAGGVGEPLDSVDRARAVRFFDELMHARNERVRALEALLNGNGVTLTPDRDGIRRLNEWYRDNVSASPDDPRRLADRWFAVGLDVGLYLGEAIIRRAPHITWALHTGKPDNISYQRPVLVGFRNVRNPRYNIDPNLLVNGYGHRVIAGETEDRLLFVDLLETAVERA